MTKSKEIYKGRSYVATEYEGQIIVQSRRTGKGILIKQGKHWIEAIKTAIDPNEAHFICGALYKQL